MNSSLEGSVLFSLPRRWFIALIGGISDCSSELKGSFSFIRLL
ncbi:hypothetical protein LEP1GSC062_3154 [Leptospira alexanderi serovar Manhao 3 str. L 60]|uniref:Uncharacterized protein n=1 Tax=Leptospira alexanderi serovar Manhao 3 str. L 60 TaxID=1049759 RepID=V6ICH4_9LEPT|nr:hypothetical protein LEP1GSC062_3154 [Leptospira alexanderi serovar Manhao 3 str. L 60]